MYNVHSLFVFFLWSVHNKIIHIHAKSFTFLSNLRVKLPITEIKKGNILVLYLLLLFDFILSGLNIKNVL